MLRHLRHIRIRSLASIGIATALMAINPASAQSQRAYGSDLNTAIQGQFSMDSGQQKAGSIAKSSVGVAGQRQGSQEFTNIKPMARLNTRIANRIQSRIRNRIDQSYNPQADATSPFKVAADQTRIASSPR